MPVYCYIQGHSDELIHDGPDGPLEAAGIALHLASVAVFTNQEKTFVVSGGQSKSTLPLVPKLASLA